MKTVGAHEAKKHLPKLLDQVSKGEEIAITRHGRPVAILRPLPQKAKPDPATAIENLKKFRAKQSLTGLSLRDMIEKGRA